MQTRKNPPTIGVVAGQGSYEKLPRNSTTPLDTLREAQGLIAALLVTAGRLDVTGCRLLALIGGAR